jgi:hypothetical protein
VTALASLEPEQRALVEDLWRRHLDVKTDLEAQADRLRAENERAKALVVSLKTALWKVTHRRAA